MTNLLFAGVPFALASAALFGASTPLAKLLVGEMDPWLLAGVLYLAQAWASPSCGLGFAPLARLRRGAPATGRPAVAAGTIFFAVFWDLCC